MSFESLLSLEAPPNKSGRDFYIRSVAIFAMVVLPFLLKSEEAQVNIKVADDSWSFKVKYQFDLAGPYLNLLKQAGFSQVIVDPYLSRHEYNVEFIGSSDKYVSTTDTGPGNLFWDTKYDNKLGACRLICSHAAIKAEDNSYNLQFNAIVYGPKNFLCFFYQFTVKKVTDKERRCFAIVQDSIICNQKVKTIISEERQEEKNLK